MADDSGSEKWETIRSAHNGLSDAAQREFAFFNDTSDAPF